MTTHDALLAAVLAAPDDDLPRLVYADYLEENAGEMKCRTCDGKGCPLCGGDGRERHWECGECPSCGWTGTVSNGNAERAEFIRVQCDLARIRKKNFDRTQSGGPILTQEESASVPVLTKRERELWNFGAKGTWVDCMYPEFDGVLCIDYESVSTDAIRAPVLIVRRGFVSEVRCTLADWCGPRCVCRTAGGPWANSSCCKGTGFRTGIGPQIVRRHPVERVELADAVIVSAVQGSPFGTVTQRSAGPLFDIAFPRAFSGQVEGVAEVLGRHVSAAAIAWAKSQNVTAKDYSDYNDHLTGEVFRGLGIPSHLAGITST